jgi:biopolymer transport protein ExbB
MVETIASLASETVRFFAESPERLGDYMESGGRVLWGILILALALWTVLIERFWFYRVESARLIDETVAAWKKRADTTSWYAKAIRDAMIAELSMKLRQRVVLAQTLVAMCPLLGILGTVTGMITVFEVMAFSGGGNARGLAAGISQATLPTMSGLVVAISGLYFTAWVERQAERLSERLADQLRHL